MKPSTLLEIKHAVNGLNHWWAGGAGKLANATVTAVNSDSRNIQPGQLFVALPGENFDGHQFLAQVFAAGAAGALVSSVKTLPADVLAKYGNCLIGVQDTIAGLGRLGHWHRDQVSAKVVAITGSNGKTTTKRMLHHILGKYLHGSCSPKSFNNNIGVPLTLLAVNEGDQYVVCEVGTNAPGEIAQLGEICRPDVAVITSVGETHLEKLGSLELVAREKSSLLKFVQPGGSAILWADSPELRHEAMVVAHEAKFPVTWFGNAADAQLRLTRFEGLGDRVNFYVNDTVDVSLPLPGRHNAMNAIAAMGAAVSLGLTLEQAADALADFGGVEMRLEVLQAGSIRLINDAYNANPSSMVAAADVLSDQPGSRRVMVAGDMRELGEQSISLHERTGRDIAARKVDLLIGIGPLGRYIAQGASLAGMRTEWFESVEVAMTKLTALLKAGDVVLIKGSRAMAMERLVGPIQETFGK